MQNGAESLCSSKYDAEEESEEIFTTTFSDLPDELQLKIFSYLTPKELCRYVAPICHEWRCKANDPSLWKVLVLKDHQMDHLERFCIILTHATMLKCLTLRALSCSLQVLACCSSSFPLLTHLDLGFSDHVDSHIISTFVVNCPLISVLNVEGCLGIDQKAVTIISTLKYLRSLNLSHCTFLSNPAIMTLAENCPRLQELNVDGITTITDSAICFLCENLQATLHCIELDGEELTDKSYKSLGQCLHLVKLGISFAEMITDDSLFHLKKLSKLHYLKLRRGTNLTAKALEALFVGPKLKFLTFLEFDSLMIEDDGIKNMTECCTELRYLGLQWCWKITDIGLESIVTNCHNLRGIDLLGLYRITGISLLKVPSNLKQLEYLNLEQCNEIIDSLLCELKKQVPDLIIKDYYGEFVAPSSDSGDENDEDKKIKC